jgi:hypothetical protein
MSLVTVHGPNTMYTSSTAPITNAGGTVTPSLSNGMSFTFAGAGDRAAADYDWSWTPTNAGDNPASPKLDTKSGTIVFGISGAHTITLTVGSSAGTTPAPGTYTYNVTAVAGPRSGEEEAAPESAPAASAAPQVEVGYDPAAHTVPEVVEFVEANPDQLDAILAAEEAGENRSTLITQLERMRP